MGGAGGRGRGAEAEVNEVNVEGYPFSADRLVTYVPCGDVKSFDAAGTDCASKRSHGGRSPRRGRASATGSAAPLLRNTSELCRQLNSSNSDNKRAHMPPTSESAPGSKAPALRRLRQQSAGSKAPPRGQRALRQRPANLHRLDFLIVAALAWQSMLV